MGANSVFEDDRTPSVEELSRMGREKLLALQREAAERLENQRQIFGASYRPGRQAYLQSSLQRDIYSIRDALLKLDAAEGVKYEIRVKFNSREDIAEQLADARGEASRTRYDEGTDLADLERVQGALRTAEESAKELEQIGFPLSQKEMAEAERRLEDRKFRMRYGVRRMDEKQVCSRCRASIFSGSAYCSFCGVLVGARPETTIFISYASEDRATIVDPLVIELRKSGVPFWYDKLEIRWGDSLTEKINEALARSDYVIAVITKNFVNKPWPRRELNAAIGLEITSGRTRVLPLLAATSSEKAEILAALPLQNDRQYVEWRGMASDVILALKERLSRS
jgi:hypothetical protein